MSGSWRGWLWRYGWRQLTYLWQRVTRGWDDSDLWNLDVTAAAWLLPRLRRFRDYQKGTPGVFESDEEWRAVLDEIVWALERITSGEFHVEQAESERIDAAMVQLGRHWRFLWD